jgi:mRNA interferase MazF
MYEKDFEGWNGVKQSLDKKELSHVPVFQEREIWWCSIGVNVGNEEDGKNRLYNRPVLIVKKFSKRLFWGVAMTTHVKEHPQYLLVEFQGEKVCVMLSHLRLYDSKRLSTGRSKMGRLSSSQFEKVKAALKEFL